MDYEGATQEERARANDLRRRAYAKNAAKYDKQIGFFERRVFGTDHRSWACSRARGRTLEVAVGTGLNLPHYSAEVELTGIDLSPEMLELAVRRTEDLGRRAELKVGDAQELPFPDAYFDTVLCTFSLCNIPDVRRSISEMKRVLKPGGRMILVDHIGSSVRPIFWLQRFIEFFSKRIEGEHLTRRPAIAVREAGFSFKENELSHAGIIERLVAEKP